MKCKYCGLDAGLFKRKHNACEEKYHAGIKEVQNVLSRYFLGQIDIQGVLNIIQIVQRDQYLSLQDIEDCCRKGIVTFTYALRLPITKKHILLIDTFIHRIGITFDVLNSHGDLDMLGKCLYRGVLMSYFEDNISLFKVQQRSRIVETLLPLTNANKEDIAFYVLDNAARHYMENSLISDTEQTKLEDFKRLFKLNINASLPQYKGSYIEKIQQSFILRDIKKGIQPVSDIYRNLPILLSRGEYVIWTYESVTMYQEIVSREWVAQNRGWSFRMLKGINYRIGRTKGYPLVRSSMVNIGCGILILTNKNIFFHCSMKSIRIPYNKLIRINPYSDGIEIHIDNTKAQRIVYLGFDSSFFIQLLSLETM